MGDRFGIGDRSRIMQTECIKRYAHTWNVFERIVTDFNPDAWLHTGRKTVTPARLAWHIVKAVKYYLEDASPIVCASGAMLDGTTAHPPDADLPSPHDIVTCLAD